MAWKYWNGQIIPSEEYHARKMAGVAASKLPFPMVISDQIEIQNQVDGKIYTSKAALRQSYRANGYVEVGNEELKVKRTVKPDRKAIKDSVRRAAARVGLPT